MDESDPKEEFKVTDKRRFTAEGESDRNEEMKSEQRTTEERPSASEEPRPSGEQPPPKPIDFSTLLLSLANTCLFQLGFVRMSEDEEVKKDLNAARQTIDILALLEEKTRGNLTDQEQKILTETLFQLRMAFVEASK